MCEALTLTNTSFAAVACYFSQVQIIGTLSDYLRLLTQNLSGPTSYFRLKCQGNVRSPFLTSQTASTEASVKRADTES